MRKHPSRRRLIARLRLGKAISKADIMRRFKTGEEYDLVLVSDYVCMYKLA